MAANADRKRLTCLLALGMILVIAAGLRIHGIALRSMSNDELGTLETTAGRGQIHLTLPPSWRRRRFRAPNGVRLHFADVPPPQTRYGLTPSL